MAAVYQIITDRIIVQLENGVVPWHKPWKAGEHGWPKNLVSKKEYRGINVFVLHGIARDIPLGTIFRGIGPFLVADLVRLTILTFFPILAIWLPEKMGMLM